MSESNIITSQYVQIRQTSASIGDRIFARMIDYAVLAVYLIAMGYFASITAPFVSQSVYYIEYLIIFLPAVFYSFICETFNNGQSLGKYLMKIRVIKKDGTQPGIGDFFMRWILQIVDIWSGLAGIISIIVTKDSQRLGDLAAGTMVVKLEDYKKMHISLDEFDYARKDYTPHYPEVQNLSVGQIHVIEKMLSADTDYNEEQVNALTRKVEKVMGTISKDRSQIKFLTTVLHDYQYYATELI
jgi:uncharacterized RDD family membrane protein YckC